MSISQRHLDELKSSGITQEEAEVAGILSVSSTKEILGFELGSGWICPFFGLNGEPSIYQVKPDNPRTSSEGKPIKYEWPKGTPLRLYIPAFSREQVLNQSEALIITEGTKKCLKANQEGFLTIALPGVYGWLRDGEPLPEMRVIPWNRRLVYLAFDSDVLEKESVQQALFRLDRFLRSMNANVKVVQL